MWVLLSIVTAIGTSISDVLGRKVIDKAGVYVVSWAWSAFTLPFLLIFLFIEGIPDRIGPAFWPAAVITTCILTVSSLLFFRAIQISDLSLSVPMLAFTPMFLLISSPLIVKEFPDPLGIVGIVLIVIGSYILNFGRKDQGLLEPFRYLFKNKGSRMVLLVAVLYSIGGNIDKIGILQSSPVLWMFSINLFVALALSVFVFIKVKKPVQVIKSSWMPLLLMGFVTSIAVVAQMYALRLTIVPYVIAIKRTSVVMTALLGLVLFKEKGFKERLTGVFFMAAGVFIISFFMS
ncbi:MAG: DMT family transporter [Candidatus Omnitrophota bacterium]